MEKKAPLRMCVACRQMQPKKNLIRIVKNKDDEIFIDTTFKANGRGAYLCNNKACFDMAVKTKALNRAFKAEIPNEILANIEKDIQK